MTNKLQGGSPLRGRRNRLRYSALLGLAAALSGTVCADSQRWECSQKNKNGCIGPATVYFSSGERQAGTRGGQGANARWIGEITSYFPNGNVQVCTNAPTGQCDGCVMSTNPDGVKKFGYMSNGEWDQGERRNMLMVFRDGTKINCAPDPSGACGDGFGQQTNPDGTFLALTYTNGKAAITDQRQHGPSPYYGCAAHVPAFLAAIDGSSNNPPSSVADFQAGAVSDLTNSGVSAERAQDRADQQAQLAAQAHDRALRNCDINNTVCERNCDTQASIASSAALAMVGAASHWRTNSDTVQQAQQTQYENASRCKSSCSIASNSCTQRAESQ